MREILATESYNHFGTLESLWEEQYKTDRVKIGPGEFGSLYYYLLPPLPKPRIDDGIGGLGHISKFTAEELFVRTLVPQPQNLYSVEQIYGNRLGKQLYVFICCWG